MNNKDRVISGAGPVGLVKIEGQIITFVLDSVTGREQWRDVPSIANRSADGNTPPYRDVHTSAGDSTLDLFDLLFADPSQHKPVLCRRSLSVVEHQSYYS